MHCSWGSSSHRSRTPSQDQKHRKVKQVRDHTGGVEQQKWVKNGGFVICFPMKSPFLFTILYVYICEKWWICHGQIMMAVQRENHLSMGILSWAWDNWNRRITENLMVKNFVILPSGNYPVYRLYFFRSQNQLES